MTKDYHHTSDEVLLRRIKLKDRQAFEMLLEKHSKRFYHLSYSLILQREEAEDILHDAFLKLWNKPYLWREGKGAKFTTWFYKIVTNLCIDWLKKKKPLLIEEVYDIHDTSDNAEEIISKKENQKKIKDLLASLTHYQRTSLTLCYYHDLSHKQAANIMGISVKAMESHLVRAKSAIKKKIEQGL